MSKSSTVLLLSGLLILSLIGCGDKATLPIDSGFGPRPTLPAPNPTLIPTIDIAPAKGWPAGAMPTAAAGFSVSAYATGLAHPQRATSPRWRRDTRSLTALSFRHVGPVR